MTRPVSVASVGDMTSNLATIPVAPAERINVATAIRAHLAVRNLSDTKAGALIGLSQSAMSRRTNAQHPFDIDELAMLADKLGLKLTELIAMPTLPGLDSNQEPIGSASAPENNVSPIDFARARRIRPDPPSGNGTVTPIIRTAGEL